MEEEEYLAVGSATGGRAREWLTKIERRVYVDVGC